MIAIDLTELAARMREMQPGQRMRVPGSFRLFWPRPELPREDDHMSHRQRADTWCSGLGCSVDEMLDPPCLVIDKWQAPR